MLICVRCGVMGGLRTCVPLDELVQSAIRDRSDLLIKSAVGEKLSS